MLKQFKKKYPLGIRLLFAVVLCSSFLTILTTAVQLFFDYQADIKQIGRGIDQVREGYYESLVNSIWDLDPIQTRIVLEGITQIPGVVYAKTSVDEISVNIEVGDRNALDMDYDKHFFKLIYSVPGESIELGTLLVVISFEGAFEKLIDKVALILTANAVKTFLASLFILFVFQYLVTKHLVKLADYAGSLSLSTLDDELVLERDSVNYDELQQVCDSINMMRKNLCDEISERKQAEAALLEAYNIINKSPAVVFLWRNEENWPVEFVSENVEKVFGYASKDFLSGKILYSQIIHTEDLTRVSEEIAAFSSEPGISEFVHKPYRVITGYGEDKWFEDMTFIRRDQQGDITHYQGIVWNIDERIKAEHDKESLEDQLRQTFKMEAMGTLAGGIAHDFNNILAAILGYADMARDDIPDSSPASYEINEIIRAGNRAKELVKHILAFSRKAEESMIQVNVHHIVEEVLSLLRATIPSTIEIKKNIDTKCGKILAIPTQIHQILMNLCTNAAQAMDENGGVLELRLDCHTLDEKELKRNPELDPGSYVRFSVKDTGPGIDRKIINRIFDPYFTTKEVGKGSGMGLAVVHGIIKSHDAKITVENNEEVGSIFTVYFQRVDDLSNAHVSRKEELPTGTGSILLVDDEQSITDMMKRTIQRLGYTVTATTSSSEALNIFKRHSAEFDLLITDQTMPKLTGLELSKEVRMLKPDMPVILCTGFSTKVNQEKANQAGIKYFLMKPVKRIELAKTIIKAMDGVN